MIVGDAYTTGETFDSVNVRGMRLYSDSRMLPSALASYAPIIRGVANSNAKVTVTQNGYKIYESTVPPGEFVIDDLSPSGFGSDWSLLLKKQMVLNAHLPNLLFCRAVAAPWRWPLGY